MLNFPRRLAEFFGDGPAAPPGRSQPGPRQKTAFDRHEHERGCRTSVLPAEIANVRKLQSDAAETVARLTPATNLDAWLLAILGPLALICDAFLCLAPSANRAGILLQDLGKAEPLEVLEVLALPLLVVGFNLAAALVVAQLLATGRSHAALVPAALLVLGDGLVALLRVGLPDGPLELAEFAFFALVPPALGLFLAALCAMSEMRRAPARAARRLVALHGARVHELEEEERRAWQERTRAAAVLDGQDPDRLAFIPGSGALTSAPAMPSWVTTILVLLGLGLVALVSAGCEERANETPLALAILVDTSPSMNTNLREVAVDAVRAADDAGLLGGGAELFVYRTGKDAGLVRVLHDAVPRRFTPGGDAVRERALWLEERLAALQMVEWTEGDSAILAGLDVLDDDLEAVRAAHKLVLVVSDLRDYRPGTHFFAKSVPAPDRLVANLERDHALPDLRGVAVGACGHGTHKNEDGSPFSAKQNADARAAFQAVIEKGGGTFTLIPSCDPIDLTRAFKAHMTGGSP